MSLTVIMAFVSGAFSQETIIKNTKECLAAYNKKQEFSGSYLKIKKSKCINYYKKIVKDKFSHIEINEEI